MHDALNVDDGVWLKLHDPVDHFFVGIKEILGISCSDLVKAKHDINLVKLILSKGSIYTDLTFISLNELLIHHSIDGKGYLRIVAAPKPINIVELDAIKLLADAGVEVIACGGGGIPVLEQEHKLKGASAVIEKDAIAGKLAADLKADRLVILTSVPCVYTSFGKEDQAPIEKMTIAKAKEYIEAGEFGEGDMLPKIEAAIQFLEANPEGSVLITSLDHVSDALKGRSGTFITA
jgi:carbamate kinase